VQALRCRGRHVRSVFRLGISRGKQN
jgi:hypothetical protein